MKKFLPAPFAGNMARGRRVESRFLRIAPKARMCLPIREPKPLSR
jgi:hypothetical protein